MIMDTDPKSKINNQEQIIKHSDFSIDHILHRAGSSRVRNSEQTLICDRNSENMETFQWLQCSRYCPPKIPRIHKKETQKRQLGRHPRIPFTSYQLLILEQKFKESPYLSSEEVIVLSKRLQLADIRVKIWFQNRRARERREKNGTFSEQRSKDKKLVQEADIDSRLSKASTLDVQPIEDTKEFRNHNSVAISKLHMNSPSFDFSLRSGLNLSLNEIIEPDYNSNPLLLASSVPFLVQNVSVVNKDNIESPKTSL